MTIRVGNRRGKGVESSGMAMRCVLLAVGFAVFPAAFLQASEGMTKDQMKSAVVSDAVSIPSPGEFFAALDDHAQPNWKQMFSPKAAASTASREQMALMLGVFVAEGYLAVEAQDGQGVKNIGREIIKLTTNLGLVHENDEKSKALLSRGNSISDFAMNNDWSALREELEATQNEVKLSMLEQKDKDLIILVTAGAWIRGTQVASEFISKNYSPDLAGLLRQSAILQHLLSGLNNLPAKLRDGPLLVDLRTKLGSALPLLETNDRAPLSPEAVNALAATMQSLVTTISGGVK
jgi:hypothetical protein